MPHNITTGLTPGITDPPASPNPAGGKSRECRGCHSTYRDNETCDRCTTCDRCGATAGHNHIAETIAGSLICPPCRAACYWRCGDCGGWNRDDHPCGNACTDDDDDEPGGEDDDGEGGRIHDYGYKPWPLFHGTGPLFLGLELEVATPLQRRSQAAQTAVSWLGSLGSLKADDSIGGGFEIVTHPMGYPWALTGFRGGCCPPWPMPGPRPPTRPVSTSTCPGQVSTVRAIFSGG
jgi:hypothetical protein